MAEKKSNAKNALKDNSTLETTSEKTTKATAKKVDSTATKATATKITKSATASKADTATSKATTKAAEKPATKAASSKATSSKENTPISKTAKTTANKTAEKPATKATNSKVDDSKTTAKTANSKSATPKAEAKTTAKTVETKADTTAKNTSKAKNVVKEQKAEVPVEENSKAKQTKANKAEQEVVATKAPDKKTAKKADTKAQADEVVVAKNATAVYGTSMAASSAKNKKATETVATNTSKAKDSKPDNSNKTNKAKSDRMVADKASKKDKSESKVGIKGFASSSATAVKGLFTNKKTRYFAIAAVAIIILFILILSISVGVAGNTKTVLTNSSRFGSVKDYSIYKGSKYDYEYRTTAIVGYNAEILGTVERKIPQNSEMKNGGLTSYPQYGSGYSGNQSAIIRESNYLTSSDTRNAGGGGYNMMDKDGYLYTSTGPLTSYDPAVNENIKRTIINNDIDKSSPSGTQRQLYKHTASVGMYKGNVPDDEKALIKKVTINPRTFHSHEMYSVTGLYAPAGEVIKIEISEKDMNTTGGILIHIGQALYNRKANNIWAGKGINRMPHVLNTMLVNKNTAMLENGVYTAYVGSFLGGPIYIGNEGATFSATISGGVAYSHFILGYTTPEEYEQTKDSQVPYFDLEVWDNGCLHSGPKAYALKNGKPREYDDLFKVADLWDKITSVTTYGNNQNIVFIYDSFVAAGAAVAFPGQHAVNCPLGWMRGALDYDEIMTSGHWGNFHEYHHNFQGYGVGNGGEVTNNGLNLVSYALFTKISARRNMNNYGTGGLTGEGWNKYTCATWALNDLLAIQRGGSPSNGKQGLALYATLLHNFGAEAYMNVKRAGGGQSYENYFKKWEQITHNNMTYYFKEILDAPMSADWYAQNSNNDYPMFVPISSVYQTGRTYNYDHAKQNIQTMRPYVIPYGEEFIIDLRKYEMIKDKDDNPTSNYSHGSIVLPNGLEYSILNVSQPKNGSIQKMTQSTAIEGVAPEDYNKVFIYKPNTNALSGDIIVTLQITDKKSSYKFENVDLILEFEQSHELQGKMLERTIYEFEEGKTPTDLLAAFDTNTNKLNGAKSEKTVENKNTTQNSNSDFWPTQTDKDELKALNSVVEIKGKVWISEEDKYRFQIRGRGKMALLLSLNGGKSYDHTLLYENQKGDIVENGVKKKNYEFRDAEHSAIDITVSGWVHFKLLIDTTSNNNFFVGLGVGKFYMPSVTIDENGNTINYKGQAIYDKDGNPLVSQEVIDDSEAPKVDVTYATCYKNSYDFPENHFDPDYFFTKQMYETYYGNENIVNDKPVDVTINKKPTNNEMYNYLFDGDIKTQYTSNLTNVSDDNPFVVTGRYENAVVANRFRMHYAEPAARRPKEFRLYIGATEAELQQNMVKTEDEPYGKPVLNIKDAGGADYKYDFNFDKEYTFKYFRLEVVDVYHGDKTMNDRRVSINEIIFMQQTISGRAARTGVGDQKVKLYGDWNIQKIVSKFGRTYVGNAGATLEFKFTGTQIMLYSVASYGTNFEVYIDGKKVNSQELKEGDKTTSAVSFLSPELNYKEHNVVIKCTGQANFESIGRVM